MADNLAKARQARKKALADPWTIESSLERHKTFEAERRESLLMDEQHNPVMYLSRVEPLPNINICRKCNTSGSLVADTVSSFFTVMTCAICGTCYYPDSEPVPRSDQTTSFRGGRHHTEMPGDHYNEWDAEYRRTNKKKDKNATT
jgi:hypothetical protein